MITITNTETLNTLNHQIQQQAQVLAVIDRSMAVIEFDLSGHVLTANNNFLQTFGYALHEIKGEHHSMFVDSDYRLSPEYQAFWQKLAQGEAFSGEYARLNKEGEIVWIEASYNPVVDVTGKPYKVIKFATDITQKVNQRLETGAKVKAIGNSMAMIEFDLSGNVLDANDNFLSTFGYRLEEVQGKHHRFFIEAEQAKSSDYVQFWQKLAKGEFVAGTFKRLAKGGKVVYIQASYNPIIGINGRPCKVVKFAMDVTEQECQRLALDEATEKASQVLSRFSQGDLSAKMTGSFSGQLALLQSAINQAIGNMSSIIAQVSAAIMVVNDTSAQVSQGAADLSHRVQEQASTLENTGRTMHHMTDAVKLNTDNASQVAKLSHQVQQEASSGVSVMQQTIQAMQSIEESSKRIGDIVNIIDSIAFQTNLLALNAAVEAARAGEHGRGFAVVAGEVRALAGKSADAAKDIKSLIEESVARISAGTRLADQSGEMLNNINGSVNKVSAMIESIALASKQQANDIMAVNSSIGEIDRVTQENAALVEETTALSENLYQEAEKLTQAMNIFHR